MATLMKCGHSANGSRNEKDGSFTPCCVSCVGIVAGADEPAEVQPSLEGRQAKCWDCGYRQDSKLTLAFFEYLPERDEDRFYCGCRGWD